MGLLLRRHRQPVPNEQVVTVEEKPKKDYPKHVGGGWYELSNGDKVQGKDEAVKAEEGD